MTTPRVLWHHRLIVTKGKLTRQELGWLLMQEAQTAAERLRTGVHALKSQAPPPPDIPIEVVQVDDTFNALDDAMRMLSSLHKQPVSIRGRRGRIDVASLIWEVAPDARVSIEPGSGTEVFGDEAELRRMLHVLLGHGSSFGSAVTIKRNGDEVRVAVVLGPDSSATADTERAWISRMAIRYGGRYELDGREEVLVLAADGVDERNERAALRKELDEARMQGEAYARELAQVFAHGEESSTSSFPPPLMPSGGERLSAVSRLAGGVAALLRGVISPALRELGELRAAAPKYNSPDLEHASEDLLESAYRRLTNLADVVAELAVVGEIDLSNLGFETELAEVVRGALRVLEGKLQRAGVEVDLVVDRPVAVRLAPRTATVLVRELVSHAITASPRGAKVTVTVGVEAGRARLSVDDAGAVLPHVAHRAFLALEMDPATYGRPSAIPLFVAAEIASFAGGTLELGDAPAGGLRAVVNFAG